MAQFFSIMLETVVEVRDVEELIGAALKMPLEVEVYFALEGTTREDIQADPGKALVVLLQEWVRAALPGCGDVMNDITVRECPRPGHVPG